MIKVKVEGVVGWGWYIDGHGCCIGFWWLSRRLFCLHSVTIQVHGRHYHKAWIKNTTTSTLQDAPPRD